MTEINTFRPPLRHAALALCSVAFVALAAPASAEPSHDTDYALTGFEAHNSRHLARHNGRQNRIARRARAQLSTEKTQQGHTGFASNLVAEARRYIGTGNPTDRRTLWCARFMNMVLERSGLRGTGSDLARSFANYGRRVSGPQVGAIAVMTRGNGGGHVGVVSGVDPQGNPIVVSGNHNHRVAEAVYPRSRVYAYVMPAS